MTAEQFEDAEGRRLVEKIHERKQRVIGPEDWPTETELQADLTRPRLAVGIDPGAPDCTVVVDMATGRIVS